MGLIQRTGLRVLYAVRSGSQPQRAAFNPFVLSLRLYGVEPDDPAGAPAGLESMRAAIVAADAALADRIVLGEPLDVTRRGDEPIRMKVSLSARD